MHVLEPSKKLYLSFFQMPYRFLDEARFTKMVCSAAVDGSHIAFQGNLLAKVIGQGVFRK